MKQVGKLKLTLSGDSEVHFERTMNAPRQLVWDCHTKPALIRRWLFGPPGWLLRSGFGKYLLGLTGIGLLVYTGAHIAQQYGWVSLPVPPTIRQPQWPQTIRPDSR